MEVVKIETPELGDRSYIVHDGKVAVVVDPQRDIDRIISRTDSLGLTVTHVLETHLHNDYVTGGLELSRIFGATYVVGGGHEATYDCIDAQEGYSFTTGKLSVVVTSSPGHTVDHVSYLVSSPSDSSAVFTGGSMLFGTVGRTDLVSDDLTDSLTRKQYRSVRRLAFDLDEDIQVHPTHGFGSFCSSTSTSGADQSTIGQEKRTNIACVINDEEDFVKSLLGGLAAYPSYYAHMGLLNRAGIATPFGLIPPPTISIAEVKRRIDNGQWVIDLRKRSEYAQRHLASTIGVEYSNSFSTYLGWILPWGMPLTVLAHGEQEIRDAQRSMARIGIDRFSAQALIDEDTFGSNDVRSYRVASFGDLAHAGRQSRLPTVLDVRRHDEWNSGHIESSIHIPLQELQSRLREVPDGEVWVHCAGGFRASIGASLIDEGDRHVVLVDDDWGNAAAEGLPVVS